MKAVLQGLGLAVIAFLVFLIVGAPARLLVPVLPPSIHASGLQGTLWSASARGVRVNGFDLGRVDWHLRLLPLVWGTIAARVAMNGGQLQGDGEVQYQPGLIRLEGVSLSADGILLNPLVADLGLTVGPSALTLDLPLLVATPGGPIAAQGLLVWKGANLGAPAEADLGEVQGVLAQEADTLSIGITNKDSRIHLDGEIGIHPGWEYTTRIQVTPTPQARDKLRNALRVLGSADNRGRITLSDSGQLPLAELNFW